MTKEKAYILRIANLDVPIEMPKTLGKAILRAGRMAALSGFPREDFLAECAAV
jgi:hypothetical protein